MSKKINISDCSECFSEEVLIKFINDELSTEETSAVENHILECSICSDAVDGLFMLESTDTFLADKLGINKEIDKLVNTSSKKRTLNITLLRSVAAVALILIISGSYIIIKSLLKEPQINELENISEVVEEENNSNSSTANTQDQVADNEGSEERNLNPFSKINSTIISNSDFEVDSRDVPKEINSPINHNDKTITASDKTSNLRLEDDSSTKNGGATNSSTIGGILDFKTDTYSPGVNGETTTATGKSSSALSHESKGITPKEQSKSELSGGKDKADKKLAERDSARRNKNEDQQENSDRDDYSGTPEISQTIISEITLAEVDNIPEQSNAIMAADESELEESPIECLTFTVVEEKPVFPGGDSALLDFISKNTNYPQIAKEGMIQGKVFIQFVIDTGGNVKNVNVLKGIDPSLDAEAIRVVKMLPKWIPGKQRGKAVNVSFIIPIRFVAN